MGLWSTLGVGRTALQASQLAMEITGHNVANATTEGYARQRLSLSPNPARRVGADLLIGTGVSVVAVQAMVDRQLEERMRLAASEAGDLATRHTYLSRLENVINELRDEDLSTALNQFFNAIEDLQPDPEDLALRHVLVERAVNLADSLARTRGRLDQTRLEADARVVAAVDQVNRLTGEIADLNESIVEQERGGAAGTANDLRDRRGVLLEELASLVSIRTIEDQRGAVNVLLGNDMLVQDQRVEELEIRIGADRGVRQSVVVFASDGSAPTLHGGELAGFIASRDEVLGGVVDDLDALAHVLIREINRVHAEGQGLQPFSSVTAAVPVSDPGAVLNAAGLHYTPVHGQFTITVVEADTGVGTTTTIDVDLDGLDTDTTLGDLAAALDAVTNVRAYVDTHYHLVIESESDLTAFRFSDDSSGVLAALGINTFFSGYDSRSMAVDPRVAADVSLIAASRTGASHDASNLTAMLEVSSTAQDDLDGLTLSEYLETSATTLAAQTASARDAASAAETFLEALHAEREAHSGVSLDEEALDLMRFQRTFQAAARLVATVDELLQLLMEL